MTLSTHYYVLSLSVRTSSLYEAFRDYLIEIESEGFPIEASMSRSGAAGMEELHQLAENVEKCFEYHYGLEPLNLVILGDEDILSSFLSVTEHRSAVIGSIKSDHTGTSARKLGELVWPLVKSGMSGALDQAMRDLEVCSEQGKAVSGIQSVVQATSEGSCSTLLVEDGYRMKGSIVLTEGTPVISEEVDVRETNDDPLDVIIDKVLEAGGRVIFTPDGSLIDRERIVLFPNTRMKI